MLWLVKRNYPGTLELISSLWVWRADSLSRLLRPFSFVCGPVSPGQCHLEQGLWLPEPWGRR